MKKNLIYAGMLLLGVTVATSCSNEESLEQVVNNGKTIEAVIENAAEARTSVNDSYQVTWTAGDAFSIWNGETKAATLTLSEGEGTTSGKFTIDDAVTITEDMVALFPTSNNLSYTFATSYDSQETDAPMLGSFAEGKFTFSLLTAMVRVVVADVPAGDVSMTISSGDNGGVLTGEATLSNGGLSVPTEGQTSVSVNFKTEEAGTLTFDVPVPVQNYTNGLSVVVKSGETEVLKKTTNAFNAEKGKIYVFGAKTVSVDTTDDLTSTIQELLDGGYTVVLDGQAEEVTVSSLSVPENITATLDLNDKTLVLGGVESKAATEEYGLTNNGTLTLTNGSINSSSTSDYAVVKNNGTLIIDNVTINAVNRGVVNDGSAILNCNIVSTNSNAVCNYNTGSLTINGGTYESQLADGGCAVRMGDKDSDDAWTLTIKGGDFKAPWAALYLCNNYYGQPSAGEAEILGGTFEGGTADIGGAAVKNVTISCQNCILDVIKNLGNNPSSYACEMNGYNLQDGENHYEEVLLADVFANGGVHVLTKNVTLSESLVVAKGKDVILDFDNFTLTSTDELAAIINDGFLTLNSYYEGGIEASYRGLINRGTATLNCKITSENSNAVCGYGDTENVITINGGTYTASSTTPNTSAVRMDPRKGGVPTGSAVDFGWHLTINGGTFISENWVALEMLDNYYGLEAAGWANINAGTFTGNANYADIGGVAVKGITISNACVLTNEIIKNQTSAATINYDCIMNEYNLKDKQNHYDDVMGGTAE